MIYRYSIQDTLFSCLVSTSIKKWNIKDTGRQVRKADNLTAIYESIM
jgi:hypothetical protein